VLTIRAMAGGQGYAQRLPTRSAVDELQKVEFRDAMTVSLVLEDQESQRMLRGKVLVSPSDILYAQPGQLVSVNGFRLNLYCMGSG
jgi:hypothetical protein